MTEVNFFERLGEALQAGQRVEIERCTAQPAATLEIARENAELAEGANERGEHVARIRNQDGTRAFECGVSWNEARQLVLGGALFIGPRSLNPAFDGSP